MNYNIKLKESAIQKMRDELGIDTGIINLSSGIIQVRNLELVKKVSKKYDIDNINKIGIELLNLGNTDSLDPIVNDGEIAAAFDENKKVDIKIGSVVRFRRSETVIHAVVIAKYGECYDVAKMLLDINKAGKKKEVVLQKGTDIVFKNSTYKNQVKVIASTIHGVQRNEFISSGGIVAGEVINENKMNQIFDMLESNNEPNLTEEDVEKVFDEGEEKDTEVSDDTNAEVDKNVEIQNNESEQEETVSDFLICFEEAVETAQSVEELISNLKLEDTMLADAIKDCVENKKADFKKLLSSLQHKYEEQKSEYSKLRQNAIKNHMNQELSCWSEKEQVKMNEYTVSYLLRVIVKKFKSLKKI